MKMMMKVVEGGEYILLTMIIITYYLYLHY